MKNVNLITPPAPREKLILRILIILGLLSIANFFYWFMNPVLIQNHFLYWLLILPMIYESLRIIYIWYHYWDISIPTKPVLTRKPTVDVLTTYFPGEPYEMVKQTLLAIKQIKYPHSTYLCDEANDSHLKEFCQQQGIIHVTRNNRIDAKAGNINNALKQATGEICLILDPDHVPRENFLDEVIPYFEDEQVGFVQSVQAYYNIDESYVARGAAEQTFQFYGPMMMSMNSYGTVNAIGANCVFRRKALDSIGGHAAGLSEDMHTAMQLHARGWKSVYVPDAFTKGLSPSSLTSYYKQQLKWSRGTLELLVSVYPRLFSKFSWRQKLHYGLLPLYYLSGIFIFLSMLIPVVSLFTAIIPWRGNIINFGVMIFPVFLSVFGIRFFIQRWLWDKSERGFHVMGGLLLISAWWIFLLGTIYTFIRKNVPYLPTPKEDKDLTSWKILIPNIIIGLVSLVAIVYGLSIDFTPFSVFMAGFALLNAVFMFFSFVFAYQKQKLITFSFNIDVRNILIRKLQDYGILIWQKAALPLTVALFLTTGILHYQTEYVKWLGVQPEPVNKNSVNYLGIYAPESGNGKSDLQKVQQLSLQINSTFDIISFDLPWQNDPKQRIAGSFIDSLYNQKALPLITWEPWFYSQGGQHVFDLIEEGYFDEHIRSFALTLKAFQRPVFLRFAHEFDNPDYPWYVQGAEGSVKFKKAWIHTYEIFKNIDAWNVIWVWNPWKPEHVASFYPGKNYVDWLGVNILNDGRLDQDKRLNDFAGLYEPFHEEFKKLPLTPVMITEMGSLREEPRQAEWYKDAFASIENNFPEIKSVIYHQNDADEKMPVATLITHPVGLSTDKNHVLRNLHFRNDVPEYLFKPLPEVHEPSELRESVFDGVLHGVKGINLKQRRNWQQDYHVLNRKKLLNDFESIKKLGINTIKFEGSSIYEYNILQVASELNLDVSYGFWVSSDIDFIEDTEKAEKLKRDILNKVSRRREQAHIKSWNIQNDVQYNQKDFYLKPRLLYQNNAYIEWMKELVAGIKQIDPDRPVIVDIEVNQLSVYHARKLLSSVNGIDYLGLVVKEDDLLPRFVDYLNLTGVDFVYSEIDAEELITYSSKDNQSPFFITSWQDQHESSKVSFDGLTDRKGRFKTSYFSVQDFLKDETIDDLTPRVKILKPAILLYENMELTYHAMVHDGLKGWKFGNEVQGLSFEWSLVKCDVYGNTLAVKDIGAGPGLHLKIPRDHNYFKLLLTVSDGKSVSTELTTLHTTL